MDGFSIEIIAFARYGTGDCFFFNPFRYGNYKTFSVLFVSCLKSSKTTFRNKVENIFATQLAEATKIFKARTAK